MKSTDDAAPMKHEMTPGLTGRSVPRFQPGTDMARVREAMEKDMPQRKYLPTFAELIDRLSIVMLKAVFIPERHNDYMAEAALIEHDIDILLATQVSKSQGEAAILGAREVRAIMVTMLSNRFIWENESKARAGGSEQDRLLKLTHSINGVRNRAKNVLAEFTGERKDHKVDTLAAEIVSGAGMNWDII